MSLNRTTWKTASELLWLEFRGELLLAAFWSVYLLVSWQGLFPEFLQKIERVLGAYLSEERLGMLLSFIGISIGIYVAVLSIFATSATCASEELTKQGLGSRFVTVLMVGLSENLLLALHILLTPRNCPCFMELSISLLLLALLALWKFIRLLVQLFRINLEWTRTEGNRREKLEQDYLFALEAIQRELSRFRGTPPFHNPSGRLGE